MARLASDRQRRRSVAWIDTGMWSMIVDRLVQLDQLVAVERDAGH